MDTLNWNNPKLIDAMILFNQRNIIRTICGVDNASIVSNDILDKEKMIKFIKEAMNINDNH